jgi:hypothetical protein
MSETWKLALILVADVVGYGRLIERFNSLPTRLRRPLRQTRRGRRT